ncbi:hypothetical protein [Halobacillus litoralis]|uniref:hypothetical protein n=1 Tax=Halobacillus litoralis TaxID=45668 RepID=UPI001F4F5851|nr:hypothetical protein [Halobacillus litoralis]
MKNTEWIIGLSAGIVGGLIARSLIYEPSVTKMKFNRKKAEFYECGLTQYQDIQSTKHKLETEAVKNKN